MRVVVFGATGNVGGTVARRLLAAGVQVVAVTRDAARAAALVALGAEVAVGAPEDGDFDSEAARGADAMFWMTPPGYAVDDYPAHQLRTAHAAAKAIREQRVGRVVNLSSFGAHLASGAGPIAGLHRVEGILDDTPAAVAHLRPAMFFENFRGSAGGIAASGRIYLPIGGEVRAPMVAAADAGVMAAALLLDPSWQGRVVRAAHGPADLSFDEAAAEIAAGLLRPVTHLRVSREQARDAMVGKGVRPGFADLVLDLYEAVERGELVAEEPRSVASTTPTRLRDWACDVLGPLVAGA